MKIVFLDRDTLGNEINTKNIEEQGEYISYNLTEKNDVNERIKDAEVIITNKVYIGKEEMESAPKLKLVCVAATGYNNIDIKEALKRDITVANVKNYSTDSVAQTVFSYILAFENNIINYDRAVKNGEWSRSPFFTLFKYNFEDLSKKTLGIIGYGNIGKKTAEIAKAFGMNVLIGKTDENKEYKEERVNLEKILKESDFVSIHVPLNEKTKNMISKKELKLMKKDSIIINTARGGIINEKDLYEILLNKEIKGAAIDVMEKEPPKEGSILFGLDNIIITPHIAWASIKSRQNLADGIALNIKEYKSGNKEKIGIKN